MISIALKRIPLFRAIFSFSKFTKNHILNNSGSHQTAKKVKNNHQNDKKKHHFENHIPAYQNSRRSQKYSSKNNQPQKKNNQKVTGDTNKHKFVQQQSEITQNQSQQQRFFNIDSLKTTVANLTQNHTMSQDLKKVLEEIFQNKQISQQLHEMVLLKLVQQPKSHKISYIQPLLQYISKMDISYQVQNKYIKRYISVLENSQSDSLINIKLILRLKLDVILSHKRKITRLAKKNPSAALTLFQFFSSQDLLNDDELRIYDNFFCQNEFSLEQQIKILETFADQEKKGVFIQIFKQKIMPLISELPNKYILKIMLSYHQLKQVQGLIKFQEKIKHNIMNNKLNIREISFIIQLFHQNGIGSAELWEIIQTNYSTLGSNELFAILAGLFRNNKYSEELFMKLLTQDGKIEMITPDLTEDEFLRVMLVYFGNYANLKNDMKVIISKLIISKLKQTYPKIKYKNNSNLFTWLFLKDIPVPQSQKDLAFKLCHFLAHQKALLSLKFGIPFEATEEDQQYMNQQYSEVNQLTIVQEIIIRRKQSRKEKVRPD